MHDAPTWQATVIAEVVPRRPTRPRRHTRRPPPPTLRQWLLAVLLSRWPLILATAVGLALLLAFGQVVAGVVAQGELQRRAAAAQHESSWRCGQRDHVDRAACLTHVSVAHGLDSPQRPARVP